MQSKKSEIWVGVFMLLALVAMHLAGVVYHQFIRRDGLIRRMTRPEQGVERVPPVNQRRRG